MNATRLLWFLAVGLPGAAASQTAPKIAARGGSIRRIVPLVGQGYRTRRVAIA